VDERFLRELDLASVGRLRSSRACSGNPSGQFSLRPAGRPVEAQHARLSAFEAAAVEAERLRDLAAAMAREVAQFERRRVAVAAHGDERLTVANPLSTTGLPLEPFRSTLTGTELAERLTAKITHIEAEIARLELEATALLQPLGRFAAEAWPCRMK
jgi:hypothetical protein